MKDYLKSENFLYLEDKLDFLSFSLVELLLGLSLAISVSIFGVLYLTLNKLNITYVGRAVSTTGY